MQVGKFQGVFPPGVPKIRQSFSRGRSLLDPPTSVAFNFAPGFLEVPGKRREHGQKREIRVGRMWVLNPSPPIRTGCPAAIGYIRCVHKI